MEIISGKIPSAQKFIVYGPEGIGKSTFASHFPGPLFIDTEGSTKHLDVKRFEKPTSWVMLGAQVKYIKENPTICKTLIIDTADWAERLCIDYLCDKSQMSGIEDWGYGKGYTYVSEEFGRLLNYLDEVISNGVNVGLTAHATIHKFEQPDEMSAYDRWEMKLSKKTAALLKEWADMLLFVNYKTYVTTMDKEGKKGKAQGGKRVMYTTHHTSWDAKNRHDLPSELEFDYKAISHCFMPSDPLIEPPKTDTNPVETPPVTIPPIEDTTPPITAPPIEDKTEVVKNQNANNETMITLNTFLAPLMKSNNINKNQIMAWVENAGYYPKGTDIKTYAPDFIKGKLVAQWGTVLDEIKASEDCLSAFGS
ncbi:MAG: ATP-binding protein [Clostridiales bacterium]